MMSRGISTWKIGWLGALALVGASALVACGGQGDPDRGSVELARGLGKADGTGSCKGFCGRKAPAGCYCDESCEIFGDCCADKSERCDAVPASCEGHCGGKNPVGCYCDAGCERYGDCCADKASRCTNPPPKPSTCLGQDDCSASEFCGFKLGDCLLQTLLPLEGTCTARPEACAQLYDPVCGCDGKTYGNACSAASAGISVASKGECVPPKPAGCYDSSTCAANEFCGLKPGECLLQTFAPQQGTCTARPEACAQLYDPVCGCDGKTYGNACSAASAGISVASKGECVPPKPAGCYDSSTCAANEFCGLKPGECLLQTFAPQQGTCTARPEACAQLYDPVCGCDGKTYGNACSAASAGISVATKGECQG